MFGLLGPLLKNVFTVGLCIHICLRLVVEVVIQSIKPSNSSDCWIYYSVPVSDRLQYLLRGEHHGTDVTNVYGFGTGNAMPDAEAPGSSDTNRFRPAH